MHATCRQSAMNAATLKQMLPRNKEDAVGAKALTALGFPAVEPVLPQMLEWLKTNGSPVELVMREFFVSLGLPAVPVIQNALRARHAHLKYAVVTHVVKFWPAEAVAPLAAELQVLATDSGFYGTDLTALRLLVEHDLADRAWLEEWSRFKVNRLRELLEQAEEIQRLLAK